MNHKVLLFRVECNTPPSMTDAQIEDVVAARLGVGPSTALEEDVTFTLAVDVTPPRGVD